MSSYKDNFINHILFNSESNEWTDAVIEWEILDWEEDINMDSSCICGKENIKYLFKIKNIKNGIILFPIGSRCIEKFEREDLNEIISEKEALFKLLEKVKNNEFLTLKDSGFNRKLLRYFYDKNVFKANKYNDNDPEKDYNFLVKMFNKRNPPTDKQASKIRGLITYTIRPFLIFELTNKTNNNLF
ncbi:hypothetical protein [Spiroplasma endosymbiont of Cantharis lateralis]|uniref:hypothetical protein n=1 Tax=Spiroplasma endosymbiont of Cantharis lateralis TaxID=3066277 RepID=UPI00313A89CD